MDKAITNISTKKEEISWLEDEYVSRDFFKNYEIDIGTKREIIKLFLLQIIDRRLKHKMFRKKNRKWN